MARWLKRDSSLGFAVQSDYTTVQTSGFNYLLAGDDVSVDVARDLQQTQLLEGSWGASSAPAVGSKHGGKIKFKIPLRSCKVAYDPTSDLISANLPPEFSLLAIALGSGSANALFNHLYGAGDVDTFSPTVIGTNTGSYTTGQFFCAASDTAGTNLVTGWIKSQSGASLTLFEATATPASDPTNVYPTSTACLTSTQPSPLTIHYVGSNAALGYVLVGCVCESASLTLGARQVPVLELSYSFTSHTRSATVGGLQIPAGYERVQPSIGVKGARLTLGGVATDGVGDLKLTYTATHSYIDSHNALQGVAECIVTSKTVKISCTVPIDSTDTLTNGSSPYETKLEQGTTVNGLCLTTGTQPGKILSIFCPAVRVSAQPKLVDKGGFLCEQLEFEAAAYAADGTSPTTVDAAPADSVFRIALA